MCLNQQIEFLLRLLLVRNGIVVVPQCLGVDNTVGNPLTVAKHFKRHAICNAPGLSIYIRFAYDANSRSLRTASSLMYQNVNRTFVYVELPTMDSAT